MIQKLVLDHFWKGRSERLLRVAEFCYCWCKMSMQIGHTTVVELHNKWIMCSRMKMITIYFSQIQMWYPIFDIRTSNHHYSRHDWLVIFKGSVVEFLASSFTEKKDTVRCAARIAEVPGHCQGQVTQSLVRVWPPKRHWVKVRFTQLKVNFFDESREKSGTWLWLPKSTFNKAVVAVLLFL